MSGVGLQAALETERETKIVSIASQRSSKMRSTPVVAFNRDGSRDEDFDATIGSFSAGGREKGPGAVDPLLHLLGIPNLIFSQPPGIPK